MPGQCKRSDCMWTGESVPRAYGSSALSKISSIVKEFCFRGRFAEAIEAYASLPLTDLMRRGVVIVMQDYEQYQSVLYLYEVHRAMGSAVKPLDVAPELDAIKKVGRVEEMDMRFQELPAKEQSREEIRKMMSN
ncbi:hypothetical protein GN958_ATG08631 [Phytophthora infestans]|uniref:Uncharacterized protein n=1 Tax=Phytophthora infestans TaxID=4787 RepID=A0A8S9USY4_PHYIN|nr:hypothetical protein GN958_ATG08631 [Phytophthora infestans]